MSNTTSTNNTADPSSSPNLPGVGNSPRQSLDDEERNFMNFHLQEYLLTRRTQKLPDTREDQLAELERKLYKLDLKEGDQMNLSSRRYDQNERRKVVLAEIDAKLKEYDEALSSCHKVFNFPTASPANIQNFDQWIRDSQPLVDIEQRFLDNTQDLVAMKEDLYQQGPVVKIAGFIAEKFFPAKNDPRNQGSDQWVYYYSDDLALTIAKIIVTIIAASSLLVPIIILCFVKIFIRQMLVIVFFTLGFSACMTITQATNAEIFGATAAYSAVMVVFLGSVNSGAADNPQSLS